MQRPRSITALCAPLFCLLTLILCGGISQAIPTQDPNTHQQQTGRSNSGSDFNYPLSNSIGHHIPFQYDPLDHPYITIKISINGSKAYSFIIDTGCEPSMVIFDWTQKELNLPLAGKTIRIDPGNQEAQILKEFGIQMPEQIGPALHVNVQNAIVYPSGAFRIFIVPGSPAFLE